METLYTFTIFFVLLGILAVPVLGPRCKAETRIGRKVKQKH